MKIRMKVQMSGTRNGQRWPKRGEIAELPTAEAAHYVAAGIAEQVTDKPPAPETATTPTAEVTTTPPTATTEPPAATKRATSARKPRADKGDSAKE